MTTKTSAFATNDVVTANDLNAIYGAWNSYTPTLKQGSTTITKTVNYAKYRQVGKDVDGEFYITATGSGSAGGAISVSLPVTAAATVALWIGSGGATTSAGLIAVHFELATTTTLNLIRTDAPATAFFGADPSITVASGNIFRGEFHYEAA